MIISNVIINGSSGLKKYGLLTKCEVETKSRSINSQKKERGQYPAILTDQTWSIKDLLYGFRGNFACGGQRVVVVDLYLNSVKNLQLY